MLISASRLTHFTWLDDFFLDGGPRRIQYQSRPLLTGYCSPVECIYQSKSEEILSDNYRESLFLDNAIQRKIERSPP